MPDVDPDALAEALGRWDNSEISQYVEGTLPTIVAAARAFLEAPTAQYCKRHGSWGPEGTCEAEVRNNFDSTCEMVGRVRLVAEEEK